MSINAAATMVETTDSPVEKYRKEWQNLLSYFDTNSFDKLRFSAFNGELRVSKFRSICWAILLRVLNSNSNDWIDQRRKQRQKYFKLKNEFSINPHSKTTISNDDPLSQSEQSVWNQYFDDQNLLIAIKQDVSRTFPGVEFFRKTFIQESMANILFCYAREHPYMCYRQGMHEILAPILFVIHYDQQSLLHFMEQSENIDKLMFEVLNPEYFEADSYSLFSRVMSSIESYYKITNFKPTAGGYFPTQEEENSVNEVVIIGQLNLIRDHILAKEDEHLHNHLLKLDIQMHIFGIRWLRVLFGREFPFLDLLMLWDAIFADSDRFELPNYIVVAMLIRIREKLLLSDYTTCLMNLMKYPTSVDINLILRHALHLQMPRLFERPPNAFVYLTMQPPIKTSVVNRERNQSTTLPRKQKFIQTATTSNSLDLETESKTKAFTSKSQQQMENQHLKIHEIQYSNAINAARIEKLKASKTAGNNIIIDGFSEDSPEYIRLELQNAQTIINVSRLKLNKYVSTFRKYITRKSPEDLNQALNGLEELSAFLDVKFSITNKTSNQRIDPASEAISDPLSPFVYVDSAPKLVPISSPKIASTLKPRKNKLTEAEVKTEFVKVLEASKNPYEVEVGEDGNLMTFKTAIKNENYEIPVSPPTTNIIDSKTNLTRYEIPDNGFMRNSLKVLGTRMNVELTLFKEERGMHNDEGIPIPDPLGVRVD